MLFKCNNCHVNLLLLSAPRRRVPEWVNECIELMKSAGESGAQWFGMVRVVYGRLLWSAQQFFGHYAREIGFSDRICAHSIWPQQVNLSCVNHTHTLYESVLKPSGLRLIALPLSQWLHWQQYTVCVEHALAWRVWPVCARCVSLRPCGYFTVNWFAKYWFGQSKFGTLADAHTAMAH